MLTFAGCREHDFGVWVILCSVVQYPWPCIPYPFEPRYLIFPFSFGLGISSPDEGLPGLDFDNLIIDSQEKSGHMDDT